MRWSAKMKVYKEPKYFDRFGPSYPVVEFNLKEKWFIVQIGQEYLDNKFRNLVPYKVHLTKRTVDLFWNTIFAYHRSFLERCKEPPFNLEDIYSDKLPGEHFELHRGAIR